MQNRIFSVDSAKALKAQDYGYLNAIHYLAPHDLSGVNLCPKASAGCIALCLGWFSGQSGMVSDLDRDMNSVRLSRIEKAQRFMADRVGYMRDVVRSIELLQRRAKRMRLKLCVRMNGSSDIAWEGVKCWRNDTLHRNLFEAFPDVTFVDYTKISHRFNRQLPANYHLTLSRSETNAADCVRALGNGVNVAVVFAGNKPDTWNGFTVIDGDKHDLRHLDPRGAIGTVIGLSPKGSRAKHDQSGFVVRNAA